MHPGDGVSGGLGPPGNFQGAGPVGPQGQVWTLRLAHTVALVSPSSDKLLTLTPLQPSFLCP